MKLYFMRTSVYTHTHCAAAAVLFDTRLPCGRRRGNTPADEILRSRTQFAGVIYTYLVKITMT